MLQPMVREARRVVAVVTLCVGLAARAEAQFVTPVSVTPALELVRRGSGQTATPGSSATSVFHRITPSFSVAPRAVFRRRGPRGAMIDYAKHTVWLSANVHDVLPTRAKALWPSPVRLSVGRRGIGAGLPADYIVGLDLDAARLPGSHPMWMQVKAVLHTVRLPGPAIVMSSNGTRAFGLYW
jgi:hypothetical protein